MKIKREVFVSIVESVGGFYIDLDYCLKLVRRAGISHERDSDGRIILTADLARQVGKWIWESDDLKVSQSDQVPLPTSRRIERVARQLRQQRPRLPVGIVDEPVEWRSTYSFIDGPGRQLVVKVTNNG